MANSSIGNNKQGPAGWLHLCLKRHLNRLLIAELIHENMDDANKPQNSTNFQIFVPSSLRKGLFVEHHDLVVRQLLRVG